MFNEFKYQEFFGGLFSRTGLMERETSFDVISKMCFCQIIEFIALPRFS